MTKTAFFLVLIKFKVVFPPDLGPNYLSKKESSSLIYLMDLHYIFNDLGQFTEHAQAQHKLNLAQEL